MVHSKLTTKVVVFRTLFLTLVPSEFAAQIVLE